MARSEEPVPIEAATVRAFRVPTDTRPESDGTFEWASTTVCTIHVQAGGKQGFGYGFIDAAGARLIEDGLIPAVRGLDAMNIAEAWEAMRHATRNTGHPGLVRSALGVVDIGLWDLKGELLDVNVSTLMGTRRDACDAYGSGGFTSYDVDRLRRQLAGWVEGGIPRVKMKVGREPGKDVDRVRAAREAIGSDARLFVDANGAYGRAQAIDMAHRFADLGVTWFEEPVSSDDLAGLRRIRDRAPPGMRLAAGEYGWDVFYFRRMCEREAADVLMPDAVRCGGYTGFLRIAELCDAFSTPISAHTAPQIDVHACCAAPGVLHLEYFHDHSRIDDLLIDGTITPTEGALRPDRSRPGIGLRLKERDAGKYRVY